MMTKSWGDLLNSYFASVFTNEDTDHLPPVKQVFPGVESERETMTTETSENVATILCKFFWIPKTSD